MEKECRKCHITKPAERFYTNRSHRDGLSSYCCACMIAYAGASTKGQRRFKAPDGMKRCYGCREIKFRSDFGVHEGRPDGLQALCRVCMPKAVKSARHKNPTYSRKSSRDWAAANPEWAHDNKLRSRLGVPRGTYEKLFTEQEGKCAICGTTEPGNGKLSHFHLDHCHATQKVRGLLCVHCNRLLGGAKDTPRILQAAIHYLLLHHPELSAESGGES